MSGITKRAWLMVAVSAVLQILIFPLPNLYLLSWIAVAPLLVAILRAGRLDTLQLRGEEKRIPATPVQGFFLGYVCGIIWYAGTCYWVYSTMKHYGGIGAPGAAGLLILFCLYLGLYHGLFGLLVAILARSATRFALVLSPIIWVAVELARTRIAGFPWDLLGITQVDDVALARIARFTGAYGVSFEIVVVNAAFAAGLILRGRRRRRLLLAATAAAFVLQTSLWIPMPEPPSDHDALLVQENIPVLDSSDWNRQYFDDTLADLTRLSLSPPNSQRLRHPELIVWPESPAPFYTGDPLFRAAISHLASTSQSWVLVGSIGVQNASTSPQQATEVFNSAVLVSPGGEWNARYDKIHLVPFGEYVPFKRWLSFAGGLTKEVGDFSRGVSRQPLQAGNQKLGIFICYESIFPDEVRQFVNNGAQVLVNISNDGWYGDSGAFAQHLKQVRMRAIENSRWLLRSTNTGVTAVIGPHGQVAGTVPRKVRTVLAASYSLSNSTTFYTRHGDWFAYACAIISVVAIVVALTPGKGRRTE